MKTEHDRLSTALSKLHEQQTISDKAQAALDLFKSIDHAEHALTVFLPQAESEDTAFQIRVLELRTLTFVAYDAIQHVYTQAQQTLGQRGIVSPPYPLLDTEFPTGTILSCPETACGHGLYKVTAPCTTADIVIDEGQLLIPLNTTIPSLHVWHGLSCVWCGARLFQGGQLHTFQHGWK